MVSPELRHNIPPPEYPQFSQEAWREAGEALSGLNNGVKAALFLLIAQNTHPRTEFGPGTYISLEDLTSRFRQLFAGTELLDMIDEYRMVRGQVRSYCQESLCGVGVVAAEYDLEGKIIGFGITERGVSVGVPLALLILEWENRYQQSLYPILGQTSSRKATRAPDNIAKIVDYLVRQGRPVRTVDIANGLNLGSGLVGQDLARLKRFGFVNYQSLTSQTGKIELEYRLASSDIEQAPYIIKVHFLQELIAKILLANKDRAFSASEIIRRLPGEIKPRWQARALTTTISAILSGLARQGYVDRVNEFEGAKKQSVASIAERGEAFVRGLVWSLLRASAKQPLAEEEQTKMDRARGNFSIFTRTSTDLYYPYSKSSKMRQRKVSMARLVGILQKNEGEVTIIDLAEKLELSRNTISRFLRPRVKDSDSVVIEVEGKPVKIKIERRKGVSYYSLLRNPI